ncbi:MAG: flagellin [Alphaproteobacteria bacterium]
MTNVGTYAQHRLVLGITQETQSRIYGTQQQIATGKKSQTFSGIADESRQLVTLRNLATRADRYIANNTLVDTRLQVMETSTASLFEIASNLQVLLVNGLNEGNADALNIAGQADAMLQELQGLLNVSREGRYLFSGSRTDTPPVDITQLPDQTVTATQYSIPTSDGDSLGYYQGDTERVRLRADDDVTVSYGVAASERGFERLTRALHLVATVTDPNTETARLEEALRVVKQSIEDIPDIRSSIGNARNRIGEATARLNDYLLYSEQTISDIENVDVAEAVTRLSNDQAILQASYYSLSALSRLTMLEFI